MEQFSAISQNLGHKYVATSLKSYANYDPATLSSIIRRIDFTGNKENTC